MPKGTALLHSAQSLAESDKLKGEPNSVRAMGKGLLNRLSVEVLAIAAPGVIGSRRRRGLDVSIEGLGIDDFSLAGGLVEDGVG